MKEIANSSPFLPEEVVEQILIMLPIKSLLRSRRVCKNWFDLITSTRFINLHLNTTRSLDGRSRLLVYGDPDHRCEVYSNQNNFHFRKSDGPKRTMPCFYLSLSCNGLLCCIADRLFLYNPLIDRYLYLPSDSSSSLCARVFGFVYDHLNNDYKVLRTSYHPSKSFEIFRLSTGMWEDITVPFLPAPIYHDNQTYLNGVSYWVGFHYDVVLHKILTFDINNEVFDTIDIPSKVKYSHHIDTYLFAFDESLFLITKSYYCREFKIWKMMEYGVVESWKLVRVHDFGMPGSVKPLGFNENGQLIWFSTRGSRGTYQHGFAVTSLDKEDIDIDWQITQWSSRPSCSFYKESLALLDKPFNSERQLQLWEGEAHNLQLIFSRKLILDVD